MEETVEISIIIKHYKRKIDAFKLISGKTKNKDYYINHEEIYGNFLFLSYRWVN